MEIKGETTMKKIIVAVAIVAVVAARLVRKHAQADRA